MKTIHTVLLTALLVSGVLCIAAGIVMVSGVLGDDGDKEDLNTKAATDLPPTASGFNVDFVASKDLTIALHGQPATDPDDAQLTYLWDLGDGSAPKAGALEYNYTYASNGTYVVTLIVTDGTNYNSTSKRITIGSSAVSGDDNETIGLDGDGYDYSKLSSPGGGSDDDDDDSAPPAPTEDRSSENTIFSTSDGNGVKLAGAATIAIGVVVIAIAIIIIIILVAVVKRKEKQKTQ